MPNTKSAIVHVRKTERRTLRNQSTKSRLKTLARKVSTLQSAGDGESAAKVAREYVSALDKAAGKGIIHRNTATRRKSACSRLIFTS